MARPRANIDQEQFESLCAMQCTQTEICAVLKVTDKTLQAWCKRTYKMGFSDVFAQKRQLGKVSLRRSQFNLAKKNPTMAIWLGRQWLHQSEDGVIDDENATQPDDGFMDALGEVAEQVWQDDEE